MKKWLLIPLIIMLFAFQAEAVKKKNSSRMDVEGLPLLTYEQFSQLTNGEKRAYLRQVKQIVTDMSVAFPEIAQEMSTRSFLFAQVLGEEVMAEDRFYQAESRRIPEPKPPSDQELKGFIRTNLTPQMEAFTTSVTDTKTEGLSDEEKKNLLENHKQSMIWTGRAAILANNISDEKLKKSELEKLNKLKKQIDANEEKIKKIADDSSYKDVRDNFLQPEFDPVKDPKNSRRRTLQDPTPIPLYFDPTTKTALPNNPAPSVAKANPPAKKGSTAKEPVDPAPPNNSMTLYRCMHSGYVIKYEKCRPPVKLPWDLKDIDENTFTCGKGTILCNPILFGVVSDCDWNSHPTGDAAKKCWAEAKPVCAKDDIKATANCLSKSNSDNTLQSAVELIARNKLAYEDFLQDFEGLCKKEQINYYGRKDRAQEITRNDIRATCTVAYGRLEDVLSRFAPSETGTKSAPAAPPAAAPKSVPEEGSDPNHTAR